MSGSAVSRPPSAKLEIRDSLQNYRIMLQAFVNPQCSRESVAEFQFSAPLEIDSQFNSRVLTANLRDARRAQETNLIKKEFPPSAIAILS